MANALETSTLITNEVARIAHNASAFLGRMNTDYEKTWKGQYAPGSTIRARMPVQFTVRSGATANVQDITDSYVPLVVQPEIGIDFAITDFDLTLAVRNDGTIDKAFKNRFLKPAGLRLAAEIDYQIATIVKNGTANFIGTPGTGMSTITHVLEAKVPAQNEGVPSMENMFCALSPTANAAVVAGLATLFNDKSALSDNFKTGVVADSLGLTFAMSQNVPSHTVGPLGGTPLVAGANQGTINSGATDNPRADTTSLLTDGWTAAAAARLKKGDVITLAGVNSVNPETKADTGNLRTFVVTADVSSDGAGAATVIISPAIIAGGAYQNVTARPADNAAITIKTGSASTAYSQNILWHPDAITFVSPEMEVPGGMDMAYSVPAPDAGGISLRFVRGFDITNNKRISRFDVLYGAAVTRQGWVVRRTA
jgi:hypothetical protein